MDNQQLKAFLAVAESGSFSLAAESLFLTQSAVSKRIQTLEQQLSSQLFERHNRSVSLSESGKVLLPKARAILQLMDDTQLQLTNLAGAVSGTLSIATSHHIGLHRLPPVLKAFAREYPQARLDIHFLASEDAYQAVESRQVELALTTLHPDQTDHLHAEPLWQDKMLCVAAADHPLSQLTEVTLEHLADTPAILPEPGTITYQVVNEAFRDAGLPLNTLMPTNYLETIKMMVTAGLGWSVLPANMLDEHLVVLPWPIKTMQRQLGLIWLRHRPQSNAARAFIDMLASD
ncbi:LysR family transcriptional regulator [Oceanobacter mangrovi]|uniref:LysR family transcriptional regulator n=1 Tax=Oceanobacter mangrovi TaxID=2862510 RepID=UPI001C8E8939|nr:LysR family transcriptional regulator [Oceanobacter mangrovi]